MRVMQLDRATDRRLLMLRLPMLRHALAVAVLCALAACDRAPTTAAPAAPTPAVAAAPTSGIDLAGIDKSVKPGDDFDLYANGAWKKATEIPADRASLSTGFYVFEKAEKRNAELIQSLEKANPAAGSDERRIADYYAAYMDEAGIEQRGLAPLQPELDKVAAITDTAGLSRYFGQSLRADTDPLNSTNFYTENLFGLFVAQGLEDPGRNVGTLMQGGLGMPDREYYLAADKAMAGNRDAYKTYIASLLKLAGDADADKKAQAIFDLEMKIAKAHASVVDSQDVHKANNPWPTADFAKKAPGIDWAAFFDAAGLASQTDHRRLAARCDHARCPRWSQASRCRRGRITCASTRSTATARCCPRPTPTSASASTAPRCRAPPSSATAGSARSAPPTARSATPSASCT